MKEIILTKGFVTQVDDEDYAYLSQFMWCYRHGYAMRSITLDNGKRVQLPMANAIMKPLEGHVVDHRDRKPLNNQRHNLRVCTLAQNCQNRARRKGRSGYHGVFYYHDKRRNKPPNWHVRIVTNNKLVDIGFFDNVVEAARAYDIAAQHYHGEFAVLNFPEIEAPK